MRKLNWYWAYYPHLDAPEQQKESALHAGYIKVVSKDEADKVIAYHKYKRCLNMAEMCGNAYDKWMMKKANAIGLGKDGVEYYLEARWKVSHYMRWYKCWLKLAEKFKPNKEAK